MQTHRYNRAAALLVLTPLLLMTGGCDVLVEVLDCNGRVVHDYDIPDLVLVANAEQYSRDLLVHPQVFYQTEDERLYFDAESSNQGVVEAFTDEDGFLTVVAGHPGRAHVTVEAWDSCSGRATTSFQVEIVSYDAMDSLTEGEQ